MGITAISLYDYLYLENSLALGSDTCGHRGAMESGYTIAIMPCGLDMVVPSENMGLFLQMIDNGSLAISEYPIGRAPTKVSYVERDRLQAGIADGLIVHERSEDGGTMHAVRKAAELHRPIGCLSPNIVEQTGNRMLIDSTEPHQSIRLKNLLETQTTQYKNKY